MANQSDERTIIIRSAFRALIKWRFGKFDIVRIFGYVMGDQQRLTHLLAAMIDANDTEAYGRALLILEFERLLNEKMPAREQARWFDLKNLGFRGRSPRSFFLSGDWADLAAFAKALRRALG